jgi:hypothetical protein
MIVFLKWMILFHDSKRTFDAVHSGARNASCISGAFTARVQIRKAGRKI